MIYRFNNSYIYGSHCALWPLLLTILGMKYKKEEAVCSGRMVTKVSHYIAGAGAGATTTTISVVRLPR